MVKWENKYARKNLRLVFEHLIVERKKIVETLKKFGLTEYQSKVYSTLVFLGPSKVGEICKNSKVPQSKIYDVLEELVERQFVEVFEGRPKEFKALPPEVVLKMLIEEKERKIENLKKDAEWIKKVLRPTISEEDIIEGIWTQKGEKSKEVLNRLAKMLENCNNYAYDITRDFSYTSSFREALKKCVKRGVKIMTISMSKISEKNYYKAKWYHSLGLPIRIFETRVHPRILVVDGEEVSIRLDHNPFKRTFTFQSIWFREPSLVKVFDRYMKNLWKISKPADLNAIKF